MEPGECDQSRISNQPDTWEVRCVVQLERWFLFKSLLMAEWFVDIHERSAQYFFYGCGEPGADSISDSGNTGSKQQQHVCDHLRLRKGKVDRSTLPSVHHGSQERKGEDHQWKLNLGSSCAGQPDLQPWFLVGRTCGIHREHRKRGSRICKSVIRSRQRSLVADDNTGIPVQTTYSRALSCLLCRRTVTALVMRSALQDWILISHGARLRLALRFDRWSLPEDTGDAPCWNCPTAMNFPCPPQRPSLSIKCMSLEPAGGQGVQRDDTDFGRVSSTTSARPKLAAAPSWGRRL